MRRLDTDSLPPAEVESYVIRYRAAEEDYFRFEDYLRTRYPAYRERLGVRPPSVTDLKRLAEQHPDTLYLSYSAPGRTNAPLVCIALSAQGASAIPLKIDQKMLETQLIAWQQAILESNLRSAPTEKDLAARLYAELIEPCERFGLLKRKNGIRHLVVIPEGVLHALPFLALRDHEGHRLIERFPISVAPSLTALLEAPPVLPGRPLRVICATYAPTDHAPGKKVSPLLASLRGPSGPLRFAQREVDSLRTLFPAMKIYTGAGATESDVKRSLPEADIFHFATHARSDFVNGLRSYLMLAPERGDSREDGRLEAREVSEIPIHARMAVLSACETGVAQPQLGNGLLGFAWGFSAAGCPCVVASLWEIDDAATSKLMATFYNRLRQGDARDSALQAAIIERLRDPVTRRPFYWAAWQVIGVTDPLVSRSTRK